MNPAQADRRNPAPHPGSAEDVRLSELMLGIRDGSADALQELMEALWGELVRFVAWEVSDTDAAKDIVQGAFVHLWEHRKGWVGAGFPRAYLYRIVRHRIIDHRRHGSVRARWAEIEKAAPRGGPPTPAEDLVVRELEAAFDRAVEELSPRRREAFYLVGVRGLGHREAAEIMGSSEQTVANQVSAALRSIRRALQGVSEVRL